jgi:hypothetical protein
VLVRDLTATSVAVFIVTFIDADKNLRGVVRAHLIDGGLIGVSLL